MKHVKFKIKLIIFLLTFIGALSAVNAQDATIAAMEQSLKGHPRQDTARVNKLNALAEAYRNTVPSRSIIYFHEALDLSKKLNYPFGEATALKGIGFYHRYRWEVKEAEDTTNLALTIFIQLKHTIGQIECNYNLSQTQSYKGDKLSAINTALEALKNAKKINSVKWIILSNIQIGNIYSSVTETDIARTYMMRALDLAKAKSPDAIFRCYEVLGQNAAQDRKWSEALGIYQDALKYAIDKKHTLLYISCELDLAGVYCELPNYDSAFHLVNNVRAITSEKKDFSGYNSWANYILTKAFIGKDNYDSAIYYGLKCRDAKENMGAISYSKIVNSLLAQAYEANGNYRDALFFQKSYTLYKDSINNPRVVGKYETPPLSYQIAQQNELAQLQRKLLIGGSIGLLLLIILLILLYFARKKSESLLLNILPAIVAKEIKKNNKVSPKTFEEVTVLFTDFKNFTALSEKLNAAHIVSFLNDCFSEFDKIMERYGVEKIKTIGDSYMAAGGLPQPNKTHATDVINAGLEIQNFMKELNLKRLQQGQPAFEIRIGIHTGSVIAGVVGLKKFAYDIWGDTVNTASRMESSGETGKVNISEKTHDIVKDKFIFTDRGKVQAKSKGEMDMYFVESAKVLQACN